MQKAGLWSGSYGAASAPVLPSHHPTSWPGSQADTPSSKQTNNRRQLCGAAGGGGAGALRQESSPPLHPEARTPPEPPPRGAPSLGETTITDHGNWGPHPPLGGEGVLGGQTDVGGEEWTCPPGASSPGSQDRAGGRRPPPAAHQPCSDGLVGQVYWRRN